MTNKTEFKGLLTDKQLSSFYDSNFCAHLLNANNNINVNGKEMSWAIWNLIIIKGQIKMYVNCGMKPSRHWKITDIKGYFNFAGNNIKFLDFLNRLYDILRVENSSTDEV